MPSDKNDNLLVLEKLASALDTKSTTEELAKAVEIIVKFVEQIVAGNENERAMIDNVLTEALRRVDKRLAQIKDGRDGKPGLDGRDGRDGRDGADGYTPIKGVDYSDGKPGKDGSPDTAEQVRDKLSSLIGDDRLDSSAIKGLDEKIAKMRGNSTTFAVSRGQVKVYDLSDQLDGVTTTFSLPAFWLVIDAKLSSVPVLRPTVDYTVDGTNMQITFTSQVDASTSLSNGQSLIVIYAEI